MYYFPILLYPISKPDLKPMKKDTVDSLSLVGKKNKKNTERIFLLSDTSEPQN